MEGPELSGSAVFVCSLFPYSLIPSFPALGLVPSPSRERVRVRVFYQKTIESQTCLFV
jgi:hypothetical protein